MSDTTPKNLANFIWQVADLLRGDYKRADYGKVILPFTVLRRLECVLEPTRDAVREKAKDLSGSSMDPTRFLTKAAGDRRFYNITAHTLTSVANAPDEAAKNLLSYVRGFSPNAQEAFEKFRFTEQVMNLAEAKLLHLVVSRFADFDLHPNRVSNHEMGYVFEELIRKFAEDSNETAGEHFTPREVIKLMAGLLIAPDLADIQVPGMSRTVYDPACGTGGMLTAAEEFILSHNSAGQVYSFGQELNPESWAICRSDLMIKNQDPDNIKLGNSFTSDQLPQKKFDYMLSNPPFGVEWKKAQAEIVEEANDLGMRGRFGAGLPRINDGSLLFLQHMLSKMRPVSEGGSRLAIVFNGSPLFTGAAESGESKIRQWILENDWLEAIVALPDQLFYNTGISTYFWILTNRKAPAHQGKVVLLDAREYWAKMRKSLGDKRKLIPDDKIEKIQRLYADALAVADDPEHELHGKVKVFCNEDFGYHRITVERPLKLRFEVTDEALVELEAALKSGKSTSQYDGRDNLLAALRGLVGEDPSYKKAAFASTLRDALASLGKVPPAVDKAVWSAVSVRDAEGEPQLKKGASEPDPELRDNENVPLDEDIDTYVEREVLPHVPDAWVDHDKTKIGYEIPFTRHFYVYTPPRPLAEIDAELKELEAEIQQLLGEVAS
ncbi:type I restriction-modification system subunit M [Kribbella sp. NBC_01510]|uniref:type I restriction-modification system subunit M n=1 Tax=Kribbella sp. NBC_01510 TaxID=2903581 RepID=UPI0038635BF8